MARVMTRANLRHVVGFVRKGTNPAATVYDSIGPDFFLALDEGWLNLGLWDGDGSDASEAPIAVRRLVRELAIDLPRGGDILDVGNGLGAQDPLIREVASPSSLVAMNITRSQLVAGRGGLDEARATPVNADATRLPFADGSFDGVVSVEAAFHFPSRERFFREVRRVLRPGGVLSMSDIPTLRLPRTPREVVAGLSQLRLWGLHRGSAARPGEIVDLAERAGFRDVHVRLVGERVIGPALRFVRDRLAAGDLRAPLLHRVGAKVMLREIEVLWERRLIDYLMLTARAPGERD